MKREDITKVLERIQPAIEKIDDPNIKGLISILINLIEELASENTILRQEIQTLRDEINRLKGEQGKPDIKPNKMKDGNISSEQERHVAERSEDESLNKEGFKLSKDSLEKLKEQRLPVDVLERLEVLNDKNYWSKTDFLRALESEIGKDLTEQYSPLLIKYARYKSRNRKPKLPEIKIDREEKCRVDAGQLPPDAEFKGYEEKVVQDLLIKTDNVKFHRELYYSPSQKKTYIRLVPKGYEGEYGPHINSHIVSMKYVNNMSIPKIKEFLNNFEIAISLSYISERLTRQEHIGVFHHEKSQLYQSSLEVSRFQQIDDTTSRVDG